MAEKPESSSETREYAEHQSRSGAMVAGYEQTTRVNQPGLTLWVKLNLTY